MSENESRPNKNRACRLWLRAAIALGIPGMLLCISRGTYAETNLALGKRCIIAPRPDYAECTDERDSIQLTDGEAYGSHWSKKSTVGWRKMNTPPEITIDLGRSSTFDEVRVHTTGGGYNGVEYPKFIIVLTSKYGREYEFAGLLINDRFGAGSLLPGRGSPRTFSIKHRKASGRYVKVLLQPKGRKFFLDEIEIMQAPSGSDGEAVERRGDIFTTEQASAAVELVERQLQLGKNIASTIEYLRKLSSAIPSSTRNASLERLQSLDKELSVSSGFPSLSKLGAIHRESGVIRAGIYRQLYNKPYVCLPANSMKILEEREMLPPTDASESDLKLRLWQGEYESGAVNIINCSDTDLLVSSETSRLAGPAGAMIDNEKVVTVRRSVFVHAKGLGMIADPLVLHQSAKSFKLEPGAVGQFWLTVHSAALQAGQYKAGLAFMAQEPNGRLLPVQTVQLDIEVDPIEFNSDVALNTYCWTHPQFLPMTKGILPEAARDLREHYVNVFVVHGGSMPYPKSISPSGIITEEPSYSKFDELLRINSYARMYMFHLTFDADATGKGRFGQWMTAPWKKAFSTWLVELVAHLKQRGVDYSRFAVQPADETLNDKVFELSRFIKSVDPRINIFVNSYGKGQTQISRLKNIVDIWCLPERQTETYKSKFATIKSFGKRMWVYDAKGPGKANDPYGYYRLMPWRAFKRGQTGAGFWVYGEILPEIRWNDTLKPFGYYAVIYGAKNSPVDTLGEPIIPSRRWEAWREGVEDYQYLYELGNAIELTKKKNPAKASDAQRILDSQVDYVLTNPQDCDRAYKAREKLTEALLDLR